MNTMERLKVELAKSFIKSDRPWLLKEKDGYTAEIKRTAMAELEEEEKSEVNGPQ